MHRLIVGITSAAALVTALVVGPFGAAAAAPYVYGCTPASYFVTDAYWTQLSVYNGSAATANSLVKELAGNGALLNIDATPLSPTQTKDQYFLVLPNASPSVENATVPASIRIVSNVPLAATLSHLSAVRGSSPKLAIPCSPLLP
jgi:hypothetical protein